jgi:hypothetical protein
MKDEMSREAILEEKVAHLSSIVAQLQARLGLMEGNGDGNDRSSRRQLLKMAGAAAVGAAGGMVFRAVPASAAAGDPVLLGNPAAPATQNDSNAPTVLFPTTGATTPSPLFGAVGQQVTLPLPTEPEKDGGNAMSLTVPVVAVIGSGGVFPQSGNPPANTMPGQAALQAVAGVVRFTDPATSKQYNYAEAMKGYAAQSTAAPPAGVTANVGVGVHGSSDNGTGVVGESLAGIGVIGSAVTDLAAFGAGYIAQTPITDVNGNPVAGPPPGALYDFEQARDKDGVLWVSNTDGSWRRLNSIIPITPVRVVDTRNGTGGHTGALGGGSTTTFGPFSQVPSNALGIVANLTAANFTGAGWLAIFPAGTTWPGNSNVNFTNAAGISAWANEVTVAVGSGTSNGKVSIRVAGGVSSHAILDLMGYII